MDLSKLSDEDLRALEAGNTDALSDEGLQHLHSQVQQQPVDTTPPQQTPQPPSAPVAAVGAVQTAMNQLQPVAHFAVQHPIETGAAASYIPGVNRLPGIRDITAARQALYDRYIGQQQTFNALKSAPTNSVGGQAGEVGQTFLQNIAQKYHTVVNGARPMLQSAGESALNAGKAIATSPITRIGGVGLAGMMPTTTNANEQAELARRRQMAPTITPIQPQ